MRGNRLFDFLAASAILLRRSNNNPAKPPSGPVFLSPGGAQRRPKTSLTGLAIAGLVAGYAGYKLEAEHLFSGPVNFFSVYFPDKPKPFKPNVDSPPMPVPAVKFLHELYDTPEMRKARRASPDSAEAHFIKMHGAAVITKEDIKIDRDCTLPKGGRFTIDIVRAQDTREEFYTNIYLNVPKKVPGQEGCQNVESSVLVPINKVIVDKSSLSTQLIGQTMPMRNDVLVVYKLNFEMPKPV